MQEKAPNFKSSWCYSRFLIHFSIHKKWPILCLWSAVLQSKQVILIHSTPTYCIADQTRSKYDQPTLYRRPPRCTPTQHTTIGERDHPRPFFNRLKNLSRSQRPLRAGPTNPRCILDQHTLSTPWSGESVCWSKIQRGLVGPALRGRGEQDKFFNRLKYGRGWSRSPQVVCWAGVQRGDRRYSVGWSYFDPVWTAIQRK